MKFIRFKKESQKVTSLKINRITFLYKRLRTYSIFWRLFIHYTRSLIKPRFFLLWCTVMDLINYEEPHIVWQNRDEFGFVSEQNNILNSQEKRRNKEEMLKRRERSSSLDLLLIIQMIETEYTSWDYFFCLLGDKGMCRCKRGKIEVCISLQLIIGLWQKGRLEPQKERLVESYD